VDRVEVLEQKEPAVQRERPTKVMRVGMPVPNLVVVVPVEVVLQQSVQTPHQEPMEVLAAGESHHQSPDRLLPVEEEVVVVLGQVVLEELLLLAEEKAGMPQLTTRQQEL
jgi:hypothetical protein